jgi:fatty-acyl-CoA synthase
VADWFEEAADDAGAAPFVIFDDRSIGFADIDRRANQVAHAALASGLQRGDVVALLMENRPDYIATWLGLAKLGIVTALLNTAAAGRVLAHALSQTSARGLIVGSECRAALEALSAESLPVLVLERSDGSGAAGEPTAYDRLLDESPTGRPDPAGRGDIAMADTVLLIFTSGTTGLPKAARISHLRIIASGVVVAGHLSFGPGDVFYCVLPMFHGAGGMVVPAVAIASRTPFVLRRRFSRSAFWDDVRRHRVTGFYYIGEIVRYLLSAPPRDDDREHSLRVMTGAGLRSDLWERFTARFGVRDIQEGLGSTEGNYRLMNVDNRIGSVGRLAPPSQTNIRIVRHDFDTQDIARGLDGRPVPVTPGEVGELIAEVIGGNGLAGHFEGYTSPEATEAKLARNLFAAGDCWFRSGDLVRIDDDDYVYFVDRSGDTFRWKGENVSTQEVEEVLSAHPGSIAINVYGVAVPGQEGRAGMAAVTVADPMAFDVAAFHDVAARELPDYAVPLFLRVGTRVEMTATFKLRKADLQQEGYDPSAMRGDHLYVRDARARTYIPVTDAALARVGLPADRSRSTDAA